MMLTVRASSTLRVLWRTSMPNAAAKLASVLVKPSSSARCAFRVTRRFGRVTNFLGRAFALFVLASRVLVSN